MSEGGILSDVSELPVVNPQEELSKNEKLVLTEQRLNCAKSLLGRFLPQAAPQKPTKIILEEVPDRSFGEFDGRDTITLSTASFSDEHLKDSKQKILYEQRDIRTLVHELIHQSQAELTNYRAFEIEGENSIVMPLAEGMATLGEFYVLNRHIEEAQSQGDLSTLEALNWLKTRQLHIFTEVRRQKSGDMLCAVDYSDGLFDSMRQLYKDKTLMSAVDNDFINLLKSIDIEKCKDIKKGTPEYAKMIKNPRLLPGLEKFITQPA